MVSTRGRHARRGKAGMARAARRPRCPPRHGGCGPLRRARRRVAGLRAPAAASAPTGDGPAPLRVYAPAVLQAVSLPAASRQTAPPSSASRVAASASDAGPPAPGGAPPEAGSPVSVDAGLVPRAVRSAVGPAAEPEREAQPRAVVPLAVEPRAPPAVPAPAQPAWESARRRWCPALPRRRMRALRRRGRSGVGTRVARGCHLPAKDRA